jgi:solute carrier family 27 fatty acid transporter 1/4
MYIYTSGTTGLPKPVEVRHNRYCTGAALFYPCGKLNKNDIIYVTLPLYHANAHMIGVGCALLAGVTIALRKKFSATNFWKECIDYKCTIILYVGEICRYLVNQPASPLDRQHTVRKAIGNGMRANVWSEFKKRFGVEVLEFYASSEGNCNLINLDGKEGACGFIPLLNDILRVLPTSIIRIDEDMKPLRDKNGFCIPCKPNEKGVIVGAIGNTAKTRFTGYANDKKATNSKVIQNLFKTGQNAYNSGDLVMRDELGYVYFCDRLGDTYRWKGENVSTVEVENIISNILDGAAVVVYGVQVAEQEGKAGMAAIVSSIDIDMQMLSKLIVNSLSSFARPLFIRVSENVEHTGEL